MIEAVSVCVNYADLLAEVAPYNRPHLDRWVIVTDAKDEETRAVCRRFSLECVTSDDYQRHNGDGFNKGRMIDRGMSMLGGKDWVLHLDSDIALPVDFRQVLDDAHIEPHRMYGCDRLNVHGPEAWGRIKSRGLHCRTNGWAIHMNRRDCSIGTRVANTGHGYAPIGFFQLTHGSEMVWENFPSKRYPTVHGTAARTDVMYAHHYDRKHRVLIPELLVWHLESEKSKMGANWRGRKTRRFPPSCGYSDASVIQDS